MNQLPIFVTLQGRKVILVGEGEAADAKRRLIERAGAKCVGSDDTDARLAFVATEKGAAAIAAELKMRGLLVNVVDQPDLCDFTTPAIIDRDPVLVAIGTGGASAGLAKALRQRLEILLPQNLGELANGLQGARAKMRALWPDGAARRKAVDDALAEAGILDPLAERDHGAVEAWLDGPVAGTVDRLETIVLQSSDPDELTLRQVRLLGQADHIYHLTDVSAAILNRARADAVRHIGAPSEPLPAGLVLHLVLRDTNDGVKGRA
jgi:uroporphyrin-III C-methyltransferase / precorrin-2 dehydrogenase / sirohydrochlorin ferrochelatase